MIQRSSQTQLVLRAGMTPQVKAQYKTQSLDTSIEVELLQFQGFRAFPLWRRAEVIKGLTQSCWEMCLAGIRQQYPNASAAKARCEFARRTLGAEFIDLLRHEDERPLTILDPIGLSLEVAGILERLTIPYLIGGSLASSLLGEPRSTADIDLVADLQYEQVPSFIEAVEPEFYVSESAVREAISYQLSFNLLHQATMGKVDIFILKDQPFARSEFERRQSVIVRQNPEQSLWLPSPEDVILQKLSWYRLGGEVSDKQWRDILGVMKLQGQQLDFSYLWQWAESLRLEELLDGAFRESGL